MPAGVTPQGRVRAVLDHLRDAKEEACNSGNHGFVSARYNPHKDTWHVQTLREGGFTRVPDASDPGSDE
ncbi:MAG: hypothetical protein BRD48_05645 [Bacteroidetes bacterium QS_9_68_14]|nr:MAG: hypothetical protein BRD48_05645 [Bacteroidetes bacterium QS_9_68_14]